MANINRFYQPSAPRYTSQFIEDRYPEELIMQAGAMKYGQQQQFAKDVGEIEGLNAITPYGYRTTDMAPVVKKRYADRINEFKANFATTYDTPQAVIELSKIRTEFQGDPDRQLMVMDATQGNEERNAQMRSTDTYHLDYDPNVRQDTGRVNQFRPGDPYTPYTPLVGYTDLAKQANEEFNQVKADMRSMPILNEAGEPVGQQTREWIDPRKMEPVIQSLANRAVQGQSKEAAYMRTRFRNEKGMPRNPTYEEAYNYYKPLADKYMQERNRIDIDRVTGTGTGDVSDKGAPATQPLAAAATSSEQKKVDAMAVRQHNNINRFSAEKIPFKSNSGFNNILSRLENEGVISPDADLKEQKKALIKEITKKRDTYYSVQRSKDPTVNKNASFYLFGESVVSGKIAGADIEGSVIGGQPLLDMDKGELIIGDEITDLLKEDTPVSVSGKLDNKSMVLAPFPGAIQVDIGKKRYLTKGTEEDVKADKLMWNFNSFERSNTGIGDVFAFDIRSGKIVMTDVSDIGMTDPANLTEDGPLYIVTMKDYTDVDDYGRPQIKVKVYAKNPILEDGQRKEPVASTTEGFGEAYGMRPRPAGRSAAEVKNINDGILDDTNPQLLRVYNLSEYGAEGMGGLINDLLSNIDEIVMQQFGMRK